MKPKTIVRATTHPSEIRPNIPTAELESFARPEKKRPAIVRYPRDVSLGAVILGDEADVNRGAGEDPRLVRPGEEDVTRCLDPLHVAFAAKWHGVTTTEKASAQEHFIDLCRMLGEPTPHEADLIGAQYAFEKRVSKAAGGDGFADAWKDHILVSHPVW